MDGFGLFKWLRDRGDSPAAPSAGQAEAKRGRLTLGQPDIPRWVGLLLLVALLYLAAALPSEFQPLPVIDTVPPSGAMDVPLTTDLQVLLGAGGFKQVFGEENPVGSVKYIGGPQEDIVPLVFSHQDDLVRASLPEPLLPGRHVSVAVRTRYGRDLVWTFHSTQQDPGPVPTPLPPLN